VVLNCSTTRDRIGYHGRWPSYGTVVTSASAMFRLSQPVAYESGESITLNEASSFVR
jgi:hypothetical protein